MRKHHHHRGTAFSRLSPLFAVVTALGTQDAHASSEGADDTAWTDWISDQTIVDGRCLEANRYREDHLGSDHRLCTDRSGSRGNPAPTRASQRSKSSSLD